MTAPTIDPTPGPTTEPAPPAAPAQQTGGPAAPATSFKSIIDRLGLTAVLAVGAATLPAISGIVLLWRASDVGGWLRSHGNMGLIIYAAAFALCAGFALLPTYASAILGGWAFGFALGYPAAIVGFLVGSAIAYSVCRPTAGDRVVSIIKEHPKWEAVRAALLDSGFGRSLLIVTLVRLPPNSPFAMTNLVLASVQVPLHTYLLGTAIGMAPRTGLAVYFASTLQSMTADEAAHQDKPWWWFAAGIALSVAVLIVIGVFANRALARVTQQKPAAPVNQAGS